MTTTQSPSRPPSSEAEEEWRRIFILAIDQLAAGKVDQLQVADWAIQAQANHGHRNAAEVAHEEWISGNPPIPT